MVDDPQPRDRDVLLGARLVYLKCSTRSAEPKDRRRKG